MTSDVAPETEPSNGDSGAWLRNARQQAGLSLRQIADATKFSVRTLDALEWNRFDELPEGIYRRGLVRSYAVEVGLDPDATVRAVLDHHAQIRTDQEADELPQLRMTLAAEPADRRRLGAVISLIGTLVPIAAGVFYFTLIARGSDRPQHIADFMPPRLTDAGGAIDETARAASTAVSVMISVSTACYLQVVVDGREIVGRSVASGEMIRVNVESEVVLVGNNAGAVHFSINGRAARTLGKDGSPLSVRIARDTYQAWLIQP